MKRISVPTEQTETMTATLETALLFARRFDSYLEGFAVRAALIHAVELDGGSSMLAESFAQQSLEAEHEARNLFETFMQDRGVPRAASTGSLSYGWLPDAPEGDYFVGSHGRVFDLTVVGRPGSDPRGPRMAMLEAALFESGHPILIAPPRSIRGIGTRILIAWNCSTEQARATAFAIPILQRADQVTVLTVEGGAAVPGPTGGQLCGYLQSHGIAAKPLTVGLEGRSTGQAILANAEALGCDLLIKGAYTQSRLRQLIFGGATRDILQHATVPVLMAH
jgi:nucleotide-binding universal stress UspA family protein